MTVSKYQHVHVGVVKLEAGSRERFKVLIRAVGGLVLLGMG